MKYVAFIGTEGAQPDDALAIMQRELPPWLEEMDRRGARLLGRELDLPDTSVTVRVRGGETLVTDGPFIETKEFVAGFDLLECSGLDEAIEIAATSPVARFCPFEIRSVGEGLRLGPGLAAFGRSDDSAGTPYMLITWIDPSPAGELDDQAPWQETDAWRRDVQARGLLVLGTALEGGDAARTLRVRDGETVLSRGSFIDAKEFIGGFDVVSCSEPAQAIELAATHPMARHQAIEVRPFYSE